MAASASLKGSTADGWATLGSGTGSFFTGGAFLKLGSLGLGLGAEKNEESDFASLTAGAGLISFLTGMGLTGSGATFEMASFFAGGAAFEENPSSNLRFLVL